MKKMAHDEKLDSAVARIAGFWVAYFVNVLIISLFLVKMDEVGDLSSSPLFMALPWAVNGLFLAALMTRSPRYGLGYLIGLGFLVVEAVLYVPSCFASCMALTAVGLEPDVNTLDPFVVWFTLSYVVAWCLAGLGLSIWHFKRARR